MIHLSSSASVAAAVAAFGFSAAFASVGAFTVGVSGAFTARFVIAA